MPDEPKVVSLTDPNDQAAVMDVLRSILAAYDRDHTFQNGFGALLITIAMLIEREPGRSNADVRKRCEALGRMVHQQVMMLRERYEQTGERQFDRLSAVIDQENAARR